MEINDSLILDISVHLAASKRTAYRNSTVAMFKALAGFLQENHLATRQLPIGDQIPTEIFKLMRSDLTDEGYALIRNGLDQWMKGIGAGKFAPTDTTVLSAILTKVRKSKQ